MQTTDSFESRQFLEAQVLGAVLADETLAEGIVSRLKSEMFTIPQHRNLFRMIESLVKKREEVSTITIVANFEKHMEKVGGLSYLMELSRASLGPGYLEMSIKNLIEQHARTSLIKLLEETKLTMEDPSAGTFEEILDQFEQKALQIRPKTDRESRTVDRIIAWYEDIVLKVQDPSRAYGIVTGWADLDRMTLGFQRTNLIVVGARTSIGKSAFANEIKLRANRRGHKVADFSLEMSAEQVYTRMAANICGIPMQAIRTGKLTEEQISEIVTCMDQLRKIHIDDTRGVTAEYITSEMRRMKRQEGLDLVIIDYLQEIIEPNERNDNGGSAMHRICQKIRKAAQECDCAVIGLSQVKQEVDTRQNKRPTVADLYGGAAISAVADDILMLYRDDYYNPDTEERGIIEVNLVKQRNGPTGIVKLLYNKDCQKITSMTGRSVTA